MQWRNSICRTKNKYSIGFLTFIGFLFTSSISANVLVDIRSAGSIDNGQSAVNYIAQFSDCSRIQSFSISAGSFAKTLSVADATRLPDSPTACRISFSGTGSGSLSPQVIINFRDGSTKTHIETFSVEQTPPQLSFESVGLTTIDSVQSLIITVNASDDIDISYLTFSITGIRASDLRAVGGVISRVRFLNKTFADTDGVVRVYPNQEGQNQFSLSVPVKRNLDANAIAHDGVVIFDVTAVDSSNNIQTLSKITFTGDDVVEKATSIQAMPERIVFTNLLETATIIPSVDFQFRGLTALPGLGSGVSYTSSAPDLIAVTAGGVVYPLQETLGQAVTISISYPGVASIEIAVEVDLTKKLVALEASGLNQQGRTPI